MAEILINLRIMPDGVDTDLEEVIRKIRAIKSVRLNTIEKEPVAFGLVALKASFVSEDKEGGTEDIEKALRGIDGIKEIEVTGATRLL